MHNTSKNKIVMKSYQVQLNQIYDTVGGLLSCNVLDCPFDQSVEWSRPAVIVVPGGAYAFVSVREGEPIAMKFASKGYHTFVLKYTTHTDGFSYPTQLLELGCAVDYVRKNAQQLHVNADEIFVVGFSAGGHLVGNLAVEWDKVSGILGTQIDCRPTAVGLSYAVINNDVGHVQTFDNVTDWYPQEKRQKLREQLSLDKAVTKHTPPAYIWTTAEDGDVNPQNSLLYAMACAKNNVKYELHVYPCGWHGLSTCDKNINSYTNPDILRNSKWIDDCSAFFRLFLDNKSCIAD